MATQVETDILTKLRGAWDEDHKMNLMHYCDLAAQEIGRLRAAALTEAELYDLFIVVDSAVRERVKPDAKLLALRERLLPVYRARHTRNEHS